MAFLAATAAAFAADQASKALSGRWHVRNERGSVASLPVIWAVAVWAIVVGAVVVLLAAVPSLGTAGAIGLGLCVGGATGNLADRLRRGAVVDFIAVGRWPRFNVADAAMTVGWLLLAGSVVA